MNDLLKLDRLRRPHERLPLFQLFYRKCQSSSGLVKLFYKVLFKLSKIRNHVVLADTCKIGAGLYIGHPHCIDIHPYAVIGSNCNIHKGATIGQENRGKRKGAPTIGNKVWIGINAIVIGKITIGDDVLIAPNSYVNCDIPSHSIVFGNPCIIKHRDNATEDYIINTVNV